ncbi:MAG: endopeptidase La [Candidatus Marinimicrobia bacterium]|nr:endopeptidase La [Candidatus Neomarinimicrobiota bacterium]
MVLPVLPLADMVLFPNMIAPLLVNTARSQKLIDDVVAGHRHFLAVLQRDGTQDDDLVLPEHLHDVGCLARVIKMIKFPDDSIRVLVQGLGRAGALHFVPTPDYLTAGYELLPDVLSDGIELRALASNTRKQFQTIVDLAPNLPDELKIAVVNIDEPGQLTDLVATHLNLSLEDRQALLAEWNVLARFRLLGPKLHRELEILQLGSKIQSEVSETFGKNQREVILREQLRAIRKELGEENAQQAEQAELERRIKAAGLSAEADKAARKELERLTLIPSASPEYGVVRNYLEWLIELPWQSHTVDRLEIDVARRILDQDHYGLEKIKERILEYLAVLKLKGDMKGPILCLVGPPGVGKTSLGQSIARALDRKFLRLSLGGVRDEAEIRGHRRTYIGSLPGRIIQGLRRVGSHNPVFMLDEVDKLGSDFRGDPSSALLEVLDPEQNATFSDHYLEVPFDLSRVLFITTANLLDPVPPPLRDRMEVLRLPGYTRLEKRQIARRYLVRKQLAAHGLKARHLRFEPAALDCVIAEYTREAGVRNLDRELATICRKVARQVAEGRDRPVRITPQRARALLGPRRFDEEVAERAAEPGIAIGLAWTAVGGEILFIEATRMAGKGQLILTGSLGDVMKESARAALSYIMAHAATYKLDVDFAKTDLHVHVPAGATPKDGPSAGVALTLALLSLLRGQALRTGLAMTGEITLRGKVLPVGGIKEKVLAAARAGLHDVILPARNRPDLNELPPDIRKKLRFHRVSDLGAAIRVAFRAPTAPPPRRKAKS